MIAVPIVIVLIVAGAYVYDEVLHPDRVGRNVAAAEVDLSGLSTGEAVAAIAAYEARLVAAPAPFIVDGEEVVLDPAAAGLAVDEEAVVDDALNQRRSGGFFSDIGGWFGSWWSPVVVAIPTTIDEEMTEAVLFDWDRSVVDQPAYEGAVLVENAVAVPEYPRPGALLDRPPTFVAIATSLATFERLPVALPLTDLDPVVTNADVDIAVAHANDLIGEPVLLWREGFPGRLAFTRAGLASALRSEIVVNSPAVFVVELDEEVLRDIAKRHVDQFASEPVDASFTFDKDTRAIAIVPSTTGVVVDIDAVPGVVIDAALDTGSARLPTKVGTTPGLTTEMAEAMGPFDEVSTFTTYHPCCKSRVTNIQLLADEIDGSIVMPGETFSVNDTAGKRTLAEGYVRAGAIINGEISCCESPINIGGGTSQFATTFYNAVFFGCYEDVEHRPHSIYFSRYPYIREATLGFPSPDVKFRNDSGAPVFIDTSHTGGSITVTFYGNNGGRICTSERSGNTVTRVMTHADDMVTRESWTWNYKQPKPKEPVTTTTEAPPDTTTPPTTEPPPPDTTTPPTTAPPPPDTTTPPTTAPPPPDTTTPPEAD
ncbi:MAG: VanW family protein [Actinomycetota bacterium]|nr:VanW family protein [Actinomycetota bacterium]